MAYSIKKELMFSVNDLATYFIKLRNKLCGPYGLSISETEILFDLYHYGSSKVTDICERLNRSTNIISPSISSLEKNNIISKNKNKKDKRITLINLTDEGLKLINEILTDVSDYYSIFLSHYDESELKNILDIVNKSLAEVKEWNI